VTISAYAGVIGFQFVDPESDLSRVDGHCRIGIHPRAAVAIIVLDTVMNVALSALFIWQLRPVLSTGTEGRLSSIFKLLGLSKKSAPIEYAPSPSYAKLRNLLYRNCIGCVVLLVNVIVNNTIFLTWPFARMSHACQLMCLSDSK
jgi:peptidoglycan biosynthesis protein MviN/MurJ (putative lipid II flippase)